LPEELVAIAEVEAKTEPPGGESAQEQKDYEIKITNEEIIDIQSLNDYQADSDRDFETEVYSKPLLAGSHDENGEVISPSTEESSSDGDAAPEKGGASEREDEGEEEDEEEEIDLFGALPEELPAELPEELPAELPELPTPTEEEEEGGEEEQMPIPPPEDGPYEFVSADNELHKVNYKGGVLSGPIQIFDPSGNIKIEGEMQEGKFCGVRKSYENGVLQVECELVDNILNGYFKQFDENGNLALEMHFKDGKKHGELTKYYSDGTVETVINFEDDKMSGTMETYKNEQITMKAQYSEDKMHGSVENFYASPYGNGVMRTATYEDGELDGEELVYHESGCLIKQAEYKDGELVQKPNHFDLPKK
jgi:antitoxin component YwqK of YwqJK toxin-antitoxin module